MSSQKHNQDSQFDEVLDVIRHTEPTEEQMQAAAQRVWKKIDAARMATSPVTETEIQMADAIGVLRSQADYEALFPRHYNNDLPDALEELLEARLREDVATRRAWQLYKTQRIAEMAGQGASTISAKESSPSVKSRSWSFRLRWVSVAAMAALTIGSGWYGWNAWGPAQRGPQGTVLAANSPLYVVDGADVSALAVGASIGPGKQVRVPEGGAAMISLRDGSRVEVREGSSFQLRSFGDDITLQLLGGDVIVEAAKRSSGHLYVDSRELEVAVTGTVFSVGAGAHGSRVAVVEGSVLVMQGANKQALKPGQQYASDRSLAPVSVESQIAWSEQAEKHLALLRSLTALESALHAVQLPSLRYSSQLAPYLPANTLVLVSVPNLESPIHQAREILTDRMQQDATLREWLSQSSGRYGLQDLLAELEQISSYLGDETVIVSLPGQEGEPDMPVLAAKLKKEGLEQHLLERVRQMSSESSPAELRIYRDLASLQTASPKDTMHVAIIGEQLVLSGKLDGVRAIAPLMISETNSGLMETPYGSRIAAAYQEGAGFFLIADVGSILAAKPEMKTKEANASGFDDLRFVEIKQRDVNGETDWRSALYFNGERHGMASWLAAPRALRALEFISQDATIVTAATVKDPSAMLQDLLPLISGSTDGAKSIEKLERELNLNLRADLAEPLGNEVAFALDGPLLPIPAWKLVVQVNDPVRLNTTIHRIVEAYNRHASLQGEPLIVESIENLDSLQFHVLQLPKAGPVSKVYYTMAQGHMLVGPDLGTLRNAVQLQAAGGHILNGPEFRKLVPVGTNTGFSAVFFQQAGKTIASVAGDLTRLASEDPKRAAAIQEIAREWRPSMLTAYADANSVTIASKDKFFGLGGSSALRMGFLFEQLGALRK